MAEFRGGLGTRLRIGNQRQGCGSRFRPLAASLASPKRLLQCLPFFRSAALSLFLLGGIVFCVPGCGLSGGGIPPGPGPGNTLPGFRSFSISGKVRGALPPYDPVVNGNVSVQDQNGVTVAGPAPVLSDGSFLFSSVPTGAVTINVLPADPTLNSIRIPLQYFGGSVVQVVASPPPSGVVQPGSITLSTASTASTVHQSTEVQAHLNGASPMELAPSWIGFGGAGVLTTTGPVAIFQAQAPGAETITALAGAAVSAVTLTVSNATVPGGEPMPPNPPDLGPAGSAGRPPATARP